MKLPILKQVEYISPTGFKQAKSCQYEFYLNRMSGQKIITMPQTEQMAIGCAFDAFVKAELARLLGKEPKLAEMLNTIELQNVHVIPEGKQLFEKYVYEGCMHRLVDEGLANVELSIKKIVDGKQIKGTEKILGGIPLFGKPDAAFINNSHADWKVNGYKSANGVSPKKGYLRCIVNGVDKGRHKDYGINLEEIDEDWATQLLFYYWMASGNSEPNSKLRGAIEQIAIRGDTVAFVSIRANIGVEFQIKVFKQLTDLWNNIVEGEIEEPKPDLWKCEPFNNPKPCTLYCERYKKILGDPMRREMLVAQKLR